MRFDNDIRSYGFVIVHFRHHHCGLSTYVRYDHYPGQVGLVLYEPLAQCAHNSHKIEISQLT